MNALVEGGELLIVGAGIMGIGIAQVAAQAGHRVLLYDAIEGAAEAGKTSLQARLEKLARKGKFSDEEVTTIQSMIDPVTDLKQGRQVGLVIEAIVEDIDSKRILLQQLESIVASDCILASNTSSISITALANGLQHPARLVGMHFFNPVAVMQLVEVVSGLQTEARVADDIFNLAGSWGKTAVHARSTPGFIVNRIARPFYAESLALLQEQAATPAVLDACLRAAGFRMGPCELMDLIGHDTNFAVTRSVYAANFYDKRFTPSLVQQELVDGGLLGCKSGRGFYHYPEPGVETPEPSPRVELLPATKQLKIHGQGTVSELFITLLKTHRCDFEHLRSSAWCGLEVAGAQLRLTDGRAAAEIGAEVAVFDRITQFKPRIALAWSIAADASEQWQQDAAAWLLLCGFQPLQVNDSPGLVVARTIAMIINEAADALQQKVCNQADADAAMKLGVNYPCGPFEWLADWSVEAVIDTLDALDRYYRGERYRVSPGLRLRARKHR